MKKLGQVTRNSLGHAATDDAGTAGRSPTAPVVPHTPWFLCPTPTPAGHAIIENGSDEGSCIAICEWHIADFIIRISNAHDDMLAALIGLQIIAEQNVADLAADVQEGGKLSGSAYNKMEMARWLAVGAAISKAEGRS